VPTPTARMAVRFANGVRQRDTNTGIED
jgi:hypothetical protein